MRGAAAVSSSESIISRLHNYCRIIYPEDYVIICMVWFMPD